MIIGNLIESILNAILFPLDIINFAVNWMLGIDWVCDVISIISYVLPWENILPLIIGLISMFMYRIAIAFVKLLSFVFRG